MTRTEPPHTDDDPRRREVGDAFGRALADWAAGGTDPEVFERRDGSTDIGAGHELYVAGPAAWQHAERQALRHVRGRVLDIGCAAGRVALHLQDTGHDVVGVDASPLAVWPAGRRGVATVWQLSAAELDPHIGDFGTLVLYGNNFGIFGTPRRTRHALQRWARQAAPGARILAQSTNPWCGGVPAMDRGYYRRNVERGRLGGQLRLRIRYRRWVTPWFDWLFVSRRDMARLVAGTGWRPGEIYADVPTEPYVMVLERA
ncbi:MAG: class I SAM-dependent methyltransferase [Acidimicrobiales bacterium]